MHFLLRDDKDVFKQIFYSNGELNTSLSSSAPLFTANIRRKLVCRLTGSLYPPAPRSALALRRARAEAWGRGRAGQGTARHAEGRKVLSKGSGEKRVPFGSPNFSRGHAIKCPQEGSVTLWLYFGETAPMDLVGAGAPGGR